MSPREYEPNPFGPLPHELSGLLLSIGEEVSWAASCLADTWYVRPTPDLRERELEERALTYTLSLLSDAQELVTRANAWQAPEEVIEALEPVKEIRALLPYDDDELEQLEEVKEAWDYKRKTWRRPLSGETQALVERWFSWLRDPEPDPETGELFVNHEAGSLYMACCTLGERLERRKGSHE